MLALGLFAGCTSGANSASQSASSSSAASASWSGVIDFPVDYGQSKKYSNKDIDAAVVAVMEEFGTWKGATMNSIAFTDDQTCENDLEYCNDLRRGNASRFDAAIVLKSSFRSPNAEDAKGTAWEPDKEYKDYEWHLGRTGDGDWELVTWGY